MSDTKFNLTENKKMYFIATIEGLAKSDQKFESVENEIIESMKRSLNIKSTTDRLTEELNLMEKAFFLREMFKISISDLAYNEKEEEYILKFCEKNNINDDLFSNTKKWALALLKADIEYFDFINKLS